MEILWDFQRFILISLDVISVQIFLGNRLYIGYMHMMVLQQMSHIDIGVISVHGHNLQFIGTKGDHDIAIVAIHEAQQ